MVIGFVKVVLMLWIASTVYRWYRRITAERRETGATPDPAARSGAGPMHAGHIEDADFEEIDGGPDRNR